MTERIDPRDHDEIIERYARYNHASDWGTPEEYADCFTADGTLQAGEVEVRGREALVAYKRADQERRQGAVRRHVNGSVALEPQSDESVVGLCYLLAFNGTDRGLELVDSGVYRDELERVNGAWRFRARRLRFDHPQPLLPGVSSVAALLGGDDVLPTILDAVGALHRLEGHLGDLRTPGLPVEET